MNNKKSVSPLVCWTPARLEYTSFCDFLAKLNSLRSCQHAQEAAVFITAAKCLVLIRRDDNNSVWFLERSKVLMRMKLSWLNHHLVKDLLKQEVFNTTTLRQVWATVGRYCLTGLPNLIAFNQWLSCDAPEGVKPRGFCRLFQHGGYTEMNQGADSVSHVSVNVTSGKKKPQFSAVASVTFSL